LDRDSSHAACFDWLVRDLERLVSILNDPALLWRGGTGIRNLYHFWPIQACPDASSRRKASEHYRPCTIPRPRDKFGREINFVYIFSMPGFLASGKISRSMKIEIAITSQRDSSKAQSIFSVEKSTIQLEG
jgi:hypothetical protein